MYNTKISELEAKEQKDKKKNDQLRMRRELNEQVESQNKNKNDQMAKDRLYMASLTQKAIEQD